MTFFEVAAMLFVLASMPAKPKDVGSHGVFGQLSCRWCGKEISWKQNTRSIWSFFFFSFRIFIILSALIRFFLSLSFLSLFSHSSFSLVYIILSFLLVIVATFFLSFFCSHYFFLLLYNYLWLYYTNTFINPLSIVLSVDGYIFLFLRNFLF